MKAYIDDSMADGEVLVFGGLISTTEEWEAFSLEWRQYLEDERIQVFKMKKAAHKHAKRLYRMICDHAKAGICFVVPIAPLEKAAGRYGPTGKLLAKPYFWAFKGVINCLAQKHREWGLSEPVDFIFDNRPEEEDVLEGWEVHRDTVPDEVRSIVGRRPVFADDEKMLPLQAADMWVWWCRQTWLNNDGTIPGDSYPIPWRKIGAIPQIILQLTTEDIDQEFSRVDGDLRDIPGFLERNPGALKAIRKNPSARAFIEERHPGLLEAMEVAKNTDGV